MEITPPCSSLQFSRAILPHYSRKRRKKIFKPHFLGHLGPYAEACFSLLLLIQRSKPPLISFLFNATPRQNPSCFTTYLISHTQAHAHAYAHGHAHAHARTHARTHTRMYARARAHTYICMYAYMYTRVCVCIKTERILVYFDFCTPHTPRIEMPVASAKSGGSGTAGNIGGLRCFHRCSSV